MPSKTKKTRKTNINTRKRHSIKSQVHSYICQRGDINNLEDAIIDKDKVIDQIIDLYTKRYKDWGFDENHQEIIDSVDNDFVKFIGYRIDLEKEKDRKGVKLFDALMKYTVHPKEPKSDEKKLRHCLKNCIPSYYLLAFLGSTYHLEKDAMDNKLKNTNTYSLF